MPRSVEKNLGVARGGAFSTRGHFPGGHELAFLDVTGFPVGPPPSGDQSGGKEGGDLQDVQDPGGRGHVVRRERRTGRAAALRP